MQVTRWEITSTPEVGGLHVYVQVDTTALVIVERIELAMRENGITFNRVHRGLMAVEGA